MATATLLERVMGGRSALGEWESDESYRALGAKLAELTSRRQHIIAELAEARATASASEEAQRCLAAAALIGEGLGSEAGSRVAHVPIRRQRERRVRKPGVPRRPIGLKALRPFFVAFRTSRRRGCCGSFWICFGVALEMLLLWSSVYPCVSRRA
jgi:hypothetical protein